jgi:hypothetical protein
MQRLLLALTLTLLVVMLARLLPGWYALGL